MVALAGPRMEHHWLVRLGNCYRDRAERGQPEGMERGADAAHRRPAPRLFGLMLRGRRPADRHGGLEGGKRYNRQYLYLLTICGARSTTSIKARPLEAEASQAAWLHLRHDGRRACVEPIHLP